MSRPADWTPLATADPVPGDPAEVALAGRRLRQVADQISADVSWLRSLCTARFWYSGAGQAFYGRVDDAAAKLAQARERYLAASEALGSGVTGPGYAGALEEAQSLSLRALAKAQRAWFAMRAQLPAIMAANEGCPPYAETPPVTLLTGLSRLTGLPPNDAYEITSDIPFSLLAPLSIRRRRGLIARLSVGYYEGWRPSRAEVADLVAQELLKSPR